MERKQDTLPKGRALPQTSLWSLAQPPQIPALTLPRRTPPVLTYIHSLFQLDVKRFCGPSVPEDVFGIKVTPCPARGRGVVIRTVVSECICERPRLKIICQACGFLTEGRVRVQCPKHEKRIYLMDMEVCARCKVDSSFLRELVVDLKDSNNNDQK